MNKTGIPYLDFAWNPGGCGCSRRCPACWAREKVAHRVGTNIGCDACRDFKVHLHRERLEDPILRRKPTTIGVQFTGELFDPARPIAQIVDILCACRAAPQHTHVFLTQRPGIMARHLAVDTEWTRPNWFCGITARDQDQLAEGMEALQRIPHKIWISAEPLESRLDIKPYRDRISGLIVGTNNNADEPQTQLAWIAELSDICMAAEVPFFVKQIRVPGKRALLTDPAKFPECFKTRELAWPLGGQPAGRDHYNGRRRPRPPHPIHFRRV